MVPDLHTPFHYHGSWLSYSFPLSWLLTSILLSFIMIFDLHTSFLYHGSWPPYSFPLSWFLTSILLSFIMVPDLNTPFLYHGSWPPYYFPLSWLFTSISLSFIMPVGLHIPFLYHGSWPLFVTLSSCNLAPESFLMSYHLHNLVQKVLGSKPDWKMITNSEIWFCSGWLHEWKWNIFTSKKSIKQFFFGLSHVWATWQCKSIYTHNFV